MFFILSHSAGKQYLICMHVFGLMTQATTLKQLDEVVVSATVVLSTPSSGENDSNITEKDFVVGYPPENFRFASSVFQC